MCARPCVCEAGSQRDHASDEPHRAATKCRWGFPYRSLTNQSHESCDEVHGTHTQNKKHLKVKNAWLQCKRTAGHRAARTFSTARDDFSGHETAPSRSGRFSFSFRLIGLNGKIPWRTRPRRQSHDDLHDYCKKKKINRLRCLNIFQNLFVKDGGEML